MSKRANYFAIGLFVLAAMAILTSVVILFGSGMISRERAVLLATFKGTTNGLREGAKVKAYGVEVGTVREIHLHQLEGNDEIVIPMYLELNLNHISNLFGYSSLAEFDKEACLSAIEEGMYATLQLESFVTGLLYVELQSGSPENGFTLETARFNEFRSIPTVPTDMELLVQSLNSVVQNLSKTDFSGLVADTRTTFQTLQEDLEEIDFKSIQDNLNLVLTDTRNLVNSPEIKQASAELASSLEAVSDIGDFFNTYGGTSMTRLNDTLDSLQTTLEQLETSTAQASKWLDPSNSLYNEIITALDQIGDASRSFRNLLDYIERNPNALITGKSQDEPKS